MKSLFLFEAVHQEVDVPDDPEPAAYEEKPQKKKYEVVIKVKRSLFIEIKNWILFVKIGEYIVVCKAFEA